MGNRPASHRRPQTKRVKELRRAGRFEDRIFKGHPNNQIKMYWEMSWLNWEFVTEL